MRRNKFRILAYLVWYVISRIKAIRKYNKKKQDIMNEIIAGEFQVFSPPQNISFRGGVKQNVWAGYSLYVQEIIQLYPSGEVLAVADLEFTSKSGNFALWTWEDGQELCAFVTGQRLRFTCTAWPNCVEGSYMGEVSLLAGGRHATTQETADFIKKIGSFAREAIDKNAYTNPTIRPYANLFDAFMGLGSGSNPNAF